MKYLSKSSEKLQSMNKLWSIIKREYLVRVKSKGFILATILMPLGMVALMGVSILVAEYSKGKQQEVLVLDEAGILNNKPSGKELTHLTYTKSSLEIAKKEYEEGDYTIFVHVPTMQDIQSNKHQASYISKDKIGIKTITGLEQILSNSFKEYRIKRSEIEPEVLESFDVFISIENAEFLEGDKENSTGKLKTIIGTVLGGIMGFLMYMVIFIYGNMVMRSVMEEKINRIVEVIISSVKPFTLMLGKVLGVGLVGLTQLTFWIIVIPIIMFVMQLFTGKSYGQNIDPEMINTNIPKEQLESIDIPQLIFQFQSLEWGVILPIFVFFFLGGYLVYASFFAAIGSAIGDDLGESQSLMLPIVIPVLIAFMMMMPILEDPHGQLAIFGSLFPLFSPILMPARLAFDPPWWQIGLSMLLLILTVIGSIWIAGRIYRVGILLYGKKVNFKEIIKWFFYKT